MEHIFRVTFREKSLPWLYLANLLFGLHFFIVQYIHSSFLARYLGVEHMSFLFGIASLLSLVVLGGASYFFAQFGAFKTTFFFTLCIGVSSMFLAWSENTGLIVAAFALMTMLTPSVLLGLDMFLEHNVPSKKSVGMIRGIFLFTATVAALFSPLIAGLTAGEHMEYGHVYLVSGIFLLPFLVVLAYKFRNFSDGSYILFTLPTMHKHIREHKNIRRIAVAQFLLRFYFIWMIVYLPVYLNTVIGFSWPQIGLILFFMLLPYVFVELPAGIIADQFIGEKELLIAGFLITAGATFFTLTLHAPNIALWCTVLFVSRIGAALIESMTETYFFKKVNGAEADMVSFFRMLRPLAYGLGPLVGTIILFYTSFITLWAVLGVAMLFGALWIIPLKDTL